MRIGIIQTHGLGDIVIAAPIAYYFLEKGHQVFWPIDKAFVPFMSLAFPRIVFVPVKGDPNSIDYYRYEPESILKTLACDVVYELYSRLWSEKSYHPRLQECLTFDQYKYAVAGVPFNWKWMLPDFLKRNMKDEGKLFQTLVGTSPSSYAFVHETGSSWSINMNDRMSSKLKVIKAEPITDNPFDWLMTIEMAEEVFVIDSFFANLIDQLGLNFKAMHLVLRSPNPFTPTFMQAWKYQ